MTVLLGNEEIYSMLLCQKVTTIKNEETVVDGRIEGISEPKEESNFSNKDLAKHIWVQLPVARLGVAPSLHAKPL